MSYSKKTINFRFKIFCSPPRYDIYGNKLSQPAIPVVWAQKDKPAFCQYFTYTTTTEIKDTSKILFLASKNFIVKYCCRQSGNPEEDKYCFQKVQLSGQKKIKPVFVDISPKPQSEETKNGFCTCCISSRLKKMF